MKTVVRCLSVVVLGMAALVGCASLDERQRAWIFQPSDRSWAGGTQAAAGMSDRWIDHTPPSSDQPVRLHALWLSQEEGVGTEAAPRAEANAPVLLYLHGARFNVVGSAFRARSMHDLGFSVLSVDYRGFGKSSAALPSETTAVEDARAAWDWLAARYPDRPRYIFGHSLGSAIAIELAAQVSDETGTIVEGGFTSIPDVFDTLKWGWLPLRPFITQRFDALAKVAHIGSPLLVVHGTEDRLIRPALGQQLFEAAAQPKSLVLVQGGSHHNAHRLGRAQYQAAMTELFGWPVPAEKTACTAPAAAQEQSC